MIFTEIGAFGSKTAVIDENLKLYSYSQLNEYAKKLASIISGPPCLVFNLLSNSFHSLASYVGCLSQPSVSQLLLAQDIESSLFQNLIDKYLPHFIFAPVGVNIPNGYQVLFKDDNIRVLKRDIWVDIDIFPDLALLLPTSGSTGSPKLVRLSYKNLSSNALSISQYLGIRESDRPITTLPMNYSYGLSIVNSHLINGCAIVMNNYAVTEKAFWSLVNESRATTFGGVPFTYEMLHRLKFLNKDFPHLRYLTQAGGKLKPELIKLFANGCKAKGIEFVVMYGQTEATARMSYVPVEDILANPDSIGVAIPGGQFKLLEQDGAEVVDANCPGELQYFGDNVCLGYAQERQDLEAGDSNCGVLNTGDIALRNNQGLYKIVGRKSRFLKIVGNRYGLDEIELLLGKQGIDAVCAGQDDKLVVFVLDESDKVTVDSYLFQQLHIHIRYRKTVVLDAFPRNTNGKIDYKQLNALAQI